MRFLRITEVFPGSCVFPKEAPEVKLPEGSEGRPSFERKPKDALFSKQVASFGNLWRFLRKAARGEASRRTFSNKFHLRRFLKEARKESKH